MSRAELDQLPTGSMAGVVLPAILVVAFLTLLAQKIIPIEQRAFTSLFQGIIRLNTFLGLAIAGGLLGVKGMEYAAFIAAIMIAFVNLLCVVIVESYVGQRSGLILLVRSILANPLILA